MKYLKLFENKKIEDVIEFLWDFFIDIKDDGLEVDIKSGPFIEMHGGSEIHYDKSGIYVFIDDPYEKYGHVYVSLEHKKPIADILKRLKSIGITSHCTYSEYDEKLIISFKKKEF